MQIRCLGVPVVCSLMWNFFCFTDLLWGHSKEACIITSKCRTRDGNNQTTSSSKEIGGKSSVAIIIPHCYHAKRCIFIVIGYFHDFLWTFSLGSWYQPAKPNNSVYKGYSWKNQLSGGGDEYQPDHRAGQPTSQGLRGKQTEIQEFNGAIWAGLA